MHQYNRRPDLDQGAVIFNLAQGTSHVVGTWDQARDWLNAQMLPDISNQRVLTVEDGRIWKVEMCQPQLIEVEHQVWRRDDYALVPWPDLPEKNQ